MSDAMENGTIREVELHEIADFVLPIILSAKNEFEIPGIFEALAIRWPFFSNARDLSLGYRNEREEKEILDGATLLIREGKINEALSLAKQHQSYINSINT